jgi:hypothetical protein
MAGKWSTDPGPQFHLKITVTAMGGSEFRGTPGNDVDAGNCASMTHTEFYRVKCAFARFFRYEFLRIIKKTLDFRLRGELNAFKFGVFNSKGQASFSIRAR